MFIIYLFIYKHTLPTHPLHNTKQTAFQLLTHNGDVVGRIGAEALAKACKIPATNALGDPMVQYDRYSQTWWLLQIHGDAAVSRSALFIYKHTCIIIN